MRNPAVIYRVKPEYFDKVPIQLNQDKTEILSYRAPSDVKPEGGSLPTPLENGYFLDNIGINVKTSYLLITLYAYSMLEKAPSKEEMLKMVMKGDPFIEIYNTNIPKVNSPEFIDKLNKLIRDNEFDKFIKVK